MCIEVYVVVENVSNESKKEKLQSIPEFMLFPHTPLINTQKREKGDELKA